MEFLYLVQQKEELYYGKWVHCATSTPFSTTNHLRYVRVDKSQLQLHICRQWLVWLQHIPTSWPDPKIRVYTSGPYRAYYLWLPPKPTNLSEVFPTIVQLLRLWLSVTARVRRIFAFRLAKITQSSFGTFQLVIFFGHFFFHRPLFASPLIHAIVAYTSVLRMVQYNWSNSSRRIPPWILSTIRSYKQLQFK